MTKLSFSHCKDFCSYLIRPDTLHACEPPDTSSHLHVLMSGVHFPQTLANVWHHSAKHLPAHDHTRPPHAEVLTRLQSQFPHFFCGAQACLPQKERLAAIQTPQEALQTLSFDVNVIVCPHKPFKLVQVVVMHVLEHHKGLLLGRVGVVNSPKWHYGNWDGCV